MTLRTRKLLAAPVTVLASVAILATVLAAYANRIVVSPQTFSGRALSVVRAGPVESLIVQQATGRVLAAVGAQPGVRPVVDAAVRDALSNSLVTREIQVAAGSLQTQLVSGTAGSLTLTLPNLGPSIAAGVRSTSPQLAYVADRIGTITVVDVPIPPAASQTIHVVATAARDWPLLLVIALALVLLALILGPDRARTVRALGLGAIASGLLVVAIYLVGRGSVVSRFSAQDARAAAGAVWRIYLGGLETWGLLLAAAGAIVAVAATPLTSRRRVRR